MEAESVTELCNLLTSIDNIHFGYIEISCFELVLGTSFNDSIVITDPPLVHPEITRIPNKVPEVAITGDSTQTEEVKKELSLKLESMNVTTTLPTTKTKSSNPKEIKIEGKASKGNNVKFNCIVLENKMEGISVLSNFTNSTTASRKEDNINNKKMSATLTRNVSTSLDDIANNSVEHNKMKPSVKTNTLTEHISQDTVNILLICK